MLKIGENVLPSWQQARKTWNTTRDVEQFALAFYWGADKGEREARIAKAIQEGTVTDTEDALQQALDCVGDDLGDMDCEDGLDADTIDAVYAQIDVQCN